MTLLQPRDESTMAMVGSELYIMGGIGAHTVFLPLILILFIIIIVMSIMTILTINIVVFIITLVLMTS